MKYLILILLALPSHLFGQVNKYSDTLETEQTEIKGKLLYEIGSDVPFTGVNLSTVSHGFAGYFTYYTDGIKDTSRVTQWDLLTNKEGQVTGKLIAYKTLKGNTWETTGQTKYNSVGLKLSHYDYENNVETFYYENGHIKEEIGKGLNNTYHKFWDRDGNEIHPTISEAKDSAPLYKTLQVRISHYAVMGYFLILITTIVIIIFKLNNVEKLPKIKIVSIVLLSLVALIITFSISNYINNNLSYERAGIWGTAFGSLYSVMYTFPYLIQIIALGIGALGISKNSKAS